MLQFCNNLGFTLWWTLKSWPQTPSSHEAILFNASISLSVGLHVSAVSVMHAEWKDVISSTIPHTKASEDSRQNTSAPTPLDKNQSPERLPPYSGVNSVREKEASVSLQAPANPYDFQLYWIWWSAGRCRHIAIRRKKWPSLLCERCFYWCRGWTPHTCLKWNAVIWWKAHQKKALGWKKTWLQEVCCILEPIWGVIWCTVNE